MDTRPIGVFDSGLGGLTAVRQLRRVLPGEDIVYFGDTGRVPYGSRGRDIIVQYARQDIRFLLQQDVKFIIAACGTVSSTYPPEEAARLPVPFTGVVGATARAAVDATRNRKIGIIGTAATVRSGSYAAIIRDMMPDVQIFARACPMFVPLVENGYFNDGNPVTKLIIAEYLQELKDAGVDTLILGCTHYPLLKKMIGDFMGGDVTLIDSGKVTAQAAAAALAELYHQNLDQVEYAAEVAMEHHLGLTCDPICGLVQIPCIERNAVAAVRAMNACNLSYFLTGSRNISYDMVCRAMRETGVNLDHRFRETSEGGLAKLYNRRKKL